jgi:hypothetical protein
MQTAQPVHAPKACKVFATTRVALAVLVMTAASALAAPKPDLWARWDKHDAASTARIDHGEWSRLIVAYARPSESGVKLFAYGSVTKVDRAALNAYVAKLSATPISTFNRREQFAYWANVYNALTVKVILDHYPVASIRDIDISPGFFADGPWGAKLATVEGEKVALDDIEHRILRPIWKDPRIHYIVNCASIGCPDIPPVALTADNAEKLMNDGAVAYVNHPRGVTVKDDRIVVSSIYAWFDEDFGGTEAGVLDHLRRYAKPELAAMLAGRDSYNDDAYDWKLNGR